jgi:DNA-binding IclR family transcriptional regulator
MVAVLNFLAQHPGQSFTLTDFTKALDLSKATCHALLAGLVDAGYLYRTGDKSYTIGPGLVAIGRVAVEHYSPMQIAIPEMRILAEKFDAVCTALSKEGDESVVQAQAASLARIDLAKDTGTRRLLRPPFGGIYYAWSPPDEAERWLDQFDPPPNAQQRSDLLAGMEFVRDHGFCFGVRNRDFAIHWDSPELYFSRDPERFALSLQTEIVRDQIYDLAFVTAPVLEAPNSVAFTIGLSGFAFPVTGGKIEEIGNLLCETCTRISAYVSLP